ncbi:MAG TPA: hypothetical protein DCM50_10835, partial [Stenotrophomonas sp.]|nr:hypothetical protein [Stenotrophomonas sp.]
MAWHRSRRSGGRCGRSRRPARAGRRLTCDRWPQPGSSAPAGPGVHGYNRSHARVPAATPQRRRTGPLSPADPATGPV